MRFYLGTHQPSHLPLTEAPLFIAAQRFRRYKKLPRAKGLWALDSGGYSELNKYHRWETSPASYAGEVSRLVEEVGGLQWASAQDWMCEDPVLKKTGKSIEEHQRLTVENYDRLMQLNPGLPWVPVLQGYTLSQYLDCLERYLKRGYDLRRLPVVGVGTMCRRQGTNEAVSILSALAGQGLRIHAFGFKTLGLPKVKRLIVSCDSLAWSYAARKRKVLLPGCEGKHKRCANCIKWALLWRDEVLSKAGYPRGQLTLF